MNNKRALVLVNLVFSLLALSSASAQCVAAKNNKGKVALSVVGLTSKNVCPKGALTVGSLFAGVTLPVGPVGATGPQGPAGSDAQFKGAAAGGHLSGTFPNPIVADGVIDALNMAPLPGAKVRRNSALVVPNAGIYGSSNDFEVVLFDQKVSDNGGLYNATNQKIYTPIPGVYLVTGSVVWTSTNAGSRLVVLSMGNQTYFNNLKSYSETIPTIQNFSFLGRSIANGVVEIEVSQNSGAPLSTATSSIGHAELTVQWIAP